MIQDSKRLFIGFPIGEDISGIVEMLKTTVLPPEYIRWTLGKKLHLTLVYIGELDIKKTEILVEKMKDMDLNGRFSLSLDHTGVFPEQGSERILWMGVNEGKNETMLLQKKVADLLIDSGILFDGKNFKPHITVGRVKRNKKDRKIDSEMYLNAVFSPVRFTVKSVHLYASELLPEGAKYSSLTEVKLT